MSYYCSRRLRRKLGRPTPMPQLPKNEDQADEFYRQMLRCGQFRAPPDGKERPETHPALIAALARYGHRAI